MKSAKVLFSFLPPSVLALVNANVPEENMDKEYASLENAMKDNLLGETKEGEAYWTEIISMFGKEDEKPEEEEVVIEDEHTILKEEEEEEEEKVEEEEEEKQPEEKKSGGRGKRK
jgi:hypothetical protein